MLSGWLLRAVPVVLLLMLVSACDSPPRVRASDGTRPATVRDAPSDTTPTWLRGVWAREWIERKGVRSNTFDVHYLQTSRHFADVRFPRERSVSPKARSFDDLTSAELHALAQQRGFAGYTTLKGSIATWHHEIDFQPPDGGDDVGLLRRAGDMQMFEFALDTSYVESWRALSRTTDELLAIRETRGDRLERTLIVVGNDFLYVRNRAHDLPAAVSIDSLIARAHATRTQIVEFLDCEFSVGRVRGGATPWLIEHSTLPWREGQRVDFVDSLTRMEARRELRPRGPTSTTWTTSVNTLSWATLDSLFGRKGAAASVNR